MCSFRGFDGHNCSNNNDLIWFYLLVLSKEDGKLMADAETGEFWSFFGGFAPLPRKAATDDDKPTESSPGKLLWYFFSLMNLYLELHTWISHLISLSRRYFLWSKRDTGIYITS